MSNHGIESSSSLRQSFDLFQAVVRPAWISSGSIRQDTGAPDCCDSSVATTASTASNESLSASSTEERRFLASTFSLRLGRRGKRAVVTAIKSEIEQLEQRGQSLGKLIHYTRRMASMRARSNQEIGSMLCTKQILRHEAELRRCASAVEKLQLLLCRVEGASESDVRSNCKSYHAEIDDILALPPPKFLVFDVVQELYENHHE